MFSTYTRKDGFIYISVSVNGRRIQRSLGIKKGQVSRKTVKKIAEKKLLEILNGTHHTPVLSDAIKYYLEYIETNRKPKTLRSKVEVLNHFYKFKGNTRVSDITRKDIDNFRMLHSHKSKSTVRRYLADLKAFFSKLVEWEYIERSPMEKYPVGQTERKILFLTNDEINKLVEASPPHLKYIWLFMIYTCLRSSEVYNLKWNDIDDVFITVKGKRDKVRRIPRGRLIDVCLKNLKKTGDYVLIDSKGNHPNPFYLTKMFKKCVEKAGLNPKYNLHCLRHTGASLLAKNGVNIKHIAKLLGDELQSAAIYMHLNPEDLQDIQDKMGIEI